MNIKQLCLTSFITVLSVSFLVAAPSFAAETSAQSTAKNQRAQAILASPKVRPAISLSESKLQSCLSRETSVKTRSQNLVRMAENQLAVFDKIGSRVQDYYEKSGKTVTRYSAIEAEMESKRNLVVVALGKASAEAGEFSCTTNDPKGLMKDFQTDMRSVKTALKAYKTSVKNLIVAVRGVTASEVELKQNSKPTDTPKADKTPNPKSNSQGRGNN